MPLDFCVSVAGNEGERLVRLPLKLHENLLELANYAEFPQLKRVRGYYDRVEYSVGDLPALRSEIASLTACAISKELLVFLLQLGALLDSAIENRTSVYTSPD
jgi:hypothetical protein